MVTLILKGQVPLEYGVVITDSDYRIIRFLENLAGARFSVILQTREFI